tara:strand:+ start:254 stop:568 length:315 start_codon:yes stop_codon:yes gene_type:complete
MRETERYFRKLNAQDDFYAWLALFSIIFIIFAGYFLILFIGAYFIELVCIGSAICGLCAGENATEKWVGVILLPAIFGGVAWLIKTNLFPDAAQHFYNLIGSFG